MKKQAKKSKSISIAIKLHVHLISLFPDSLDSYINESIVGRAITQKKLCIYKYNPRDFVKVKGSQKGKAEPYLRVDDKPYGGGPGMVMEALPVVKAIEKAIAKAQKTTDKVFKIIFLSPGGRQFTNDLAVQWVDQCMKTGIRNGDKNDRVNINKSLNVTKHMHIICICGRYEGIDERVNKIFKTEKISVGPFVTTGGELPALIIIDTLTRQMPGVLGNFDSREEARFASHEVYTRPEVLEYKGKKYSVPKILISGDHKKIEEWRADNRNQKGE